MGTSRWEDESDLTRKNTTYSRSPRSCSWRKETQGRLLFFGCDCKLPLLRECSGERKAHYCTMTATFRTTHFRRPASSRWFWDCRCSSEILLSRGDRKSSYFNMPASPIELTKVRLTGTIRCCTSPLHARPSAFSGFLQRAELTRSMRGTYTCPCRTLPSARIYSYRAVEESRG